MLGQAKPFVMTRFLGPPGFFRSDQGSTACFGCGLTSMRVTPATQLGQSSGFLGLRLNGRLVFFFRFSRYRLILRPNRCQKTAASKPTITNHSFETRNLVSQKGLLVASDNAFTPGVNGRLGAVAEMQFAEDITNVTLNRLWTDKEQLSDIIV